MVDENRVTGALHQAEGAVKEGFGKLTGDKKTEAEQLLAARLPPIMLATGFAGHRLD